MPDRSSASSEEAQARRLLSAAAVRERAHQILGHGLSGRLEHFAVDLTRLDACADEVVSTIRAAYPSLEIPFHARWRHFAAGGIDRWAAVAEGVPWQSPAATRPRPISSAPNASPACRTPASSN